MNRQILTVVCGIVFFIIAYLLVSYSFYKDAVSSSEEHMVRQTRISLKEVSDRMSVYLVSRCKALKVLPMFHEIRECIASGDFSFMHKTSMMSLDESEIFVILNKDGLCTMVEPQKYRKLLLNSKFADQYSKKIITGEIPDLVSKAIPVPDPDGTGKNYYVFVFTEIRNPDGTFTGVMGLGFNVEKVFDFYYKPLESNFDGSIACVTDESGYIELFREKDAVMTPASQVKPTLLPPIPHKLQKAGYHGHHVWKNKEGKKFLIIYHPLDFDTHKWVAQLRIPYSLVDEELRPFYLKLFILLIILLATALIGIFITVSTGRQISRLKKQISVLEIQIDHEKKKTAVETITGSDYFKSLQEQAKALRKTE